VQKFPSIYTSMGTKNLQAIFNGKNFEFSKTVFTIRFPRLWRMFLTEIQKFSEISKNLSSSIYLVFFSEFFPDWGQGFAVSAPWGIEFNENVLGWVHDEFIEVLSNNNLDSIIRVIWNFF